MLNPDRYLLFVEAKSRYDNDIKTLLPVEQPDDGLGRVIVDHEFATHLDHEALASPRADADRVAFLRAESPLRRYARVVGLAAARLAAGRGDDARLWCAGEMSRRYAAVLPEASGLPVATLRLSITSGLVVFRLPAAGVTDEMVWPFFVNDYGSRLFGFAGPETGLEARLRELEAVTRRDAATTDAEWQRGDWERTVRRALSDRGEVFEYHDDDERPPAAREAARLWQELQDDCWHRDRLRPLLDDALLCVLPDGKHDGAVAFHSATLPVAPVVETLCDVVREHGGTTSIIALAEE